MMPIVVYIVVIAICILHQGKTTLILTSRQKTWIVTTQCFQIRNHTSIDVCLVTKTGITVELLAKMLLTEVTGVVEHDIEDNLDTLGVSLVDEFLEHHVTALFAVTALITAIYLGEIRSMIAVVVITGCILYDRSDPDGSETERLDVVELVDDTLEVTAPTRVPGTLLCFLVVPAEHVVFRISIVETGGDHKVDTFVSEVSTIIREVVSRHRIRRGKKQHRCKELLLELSHKKFLN